MAKRWRISPPWGDDAPVSVPPRVFSLTAHVDPAAVWARWTDFDLWPVDDPALAKARLNGPLAQGSIGWVRLRPIGKVQVRIVRVDPQTHVLDVQSPLPQAIVHYDRALTPAHDGAWTLTHTVRVTGPLARVWDVLVGRPLADRQPAVLARIAEAAASGPREES